MSLDYWPVLLVAVVMAPLALTLVTAGWSVVWHSTRRVRRRVVADPARPFVTSVREDRVADLKWWARVANDWRSF